MWRLLARFTLGSENSTRTCAALCLGICPKLYTSVHALECSLVHTSAFPHTVCAPLCLRSSLLLIQFSIIPPRLLCHHGYVPAISSPSPFLAPHKRDVRIYSLSRPDRTAYQSPESHYSLIVSYSCNAFLQAGGPPGDAFPHPYRSVPETKAHYR